MQPSVNFPEFNAGIWIVGRIRRRCGVPESIARFVAEQNYKAALHADIRPVMPEPQPRPYRGRKVVA